MTTWIEVGAPDPERLIKASRHSGRTILIGYGPTLARGGEQYLAKLSAVPNLTVLRFDQDFLNMVVARLQRSISWSLTITEGWYIWSGRGYRRGR